MEKISSEERTNTVICYN